MPDAAAPTPQDPARFVLDAGGKLLASNASARALLGLGDGSGPAVLALCPDAQPDGTPSAQAWGQREAAARGGLAQCFSWQFRRSDGTSVDALVELASDPGGERLVGRLRDLGTLRSAESALRDSQGRLQQIVDHTSAAVFVKGLDGRYLWVNREFARVAHRPAEEIAGLRDDDVFPPEAAARFRAHDLRVLEEMQTLDTEERIVVDGSERIYLKHKFPLIAADGRPYAICGISTDVTERKRVEQALRAAALAVSSAEGDDVIHELVRYLATILEVDVAFVSEFTDEAHTRLAMLAVILDGRFLKLFDYPIHGSPCAKVVGRDFRFVGSGVGSEFPPGTIFAAKGMDSYAALPLVDSAGRPLGIIAVMNRAPLEDRGLAESMLKIFAARAAAEIERRRSVEALADSEASYRAIFAASADAIFVHDWDTGRILDVSRAAEKFYGWTSEEIKHLAVEDISAADEGYTQQKALEQLERAKAGENIRFEWRVRHRSGAKAWHEVRIKPATIAGRKRLLAYTRDISATKAAEEALRASEERYRLLFEMASDAILVTDAATLDLLDANRTAEGLWGYSREELLRMKATDLSAEPEATRNAIQGEKATLTIPLRWHRRKDGTLFQVEITINRFDLDGRTIVLSAIRDVTERREREEALARSEAQYRAIFNAASDALILWDSQYRRVDVNPAYERTYGWAREEVVGRGYDQPEYSPEYAQPRRELLRRALAGETARAELEAVRKDGQRILTEVVTIPFRHHGEPHVLAIARDITESKRAEEALRDSEEQYRAIFNASEDALVLWNSRFEHVDVNAAHERMFGYTREETLGKRGLPGLTAAEAEQRREHVRRALAGERLRVEMESVRRSGERFPIEVRLLPIRHRGEPHVLAIVRDITERRRADEERSKLEAQLRQAQKMEALGHLTGGIAHDFNNLLASILGYIALAAEQPVIAGDERLTRYLEQARASCGRARDLIQQMLTFSRGRRGERRALALAPLVGEAVKLLRASFPASIAIETALDERASAVMADPVQLDQVLMNLAINARDAMEGAGRMAIRVAPARHAATVCSSCRAAFSGAFVALEVRDEGPGIPAGVRERMFEPFYSTKAVGRGTGMGLATVHGIVHDFGGHIVVDSEPGQGALFTVLLPALDRPADAPALPPNPEPLAQRALRGRVLVVEDEQGVAEFMRDMLESWSLDVTVMADPALALDRFRSDPGAFDAVITDQTMPGMTGLDLAKRVAERTPALPVLLYTGYGEGITPAMLAAAGIRQLLAKPIEPAAAYVALAAFLPVRDAPTAPA